MTGCDCPPGTHPADCPCPTGIRSPEWEPRSVCYQHTEPVMRRADGTCPACPPPPALIWSWTTTAEDGIRLMVVPAVGERCSVEITARDFARMSTHRELTRHLRAGRVDLRPEAGPRCRGTVFELAPEAAQRNAMPAFLESCYHQNTPERPAQAEGWNPSASMVKPSSANGAAPGLVDALPNDDPTHALMGAGHAGTDQGTGKPTPTGVNADGARGGHPGRRIRITTHGAPARTRVAMLLLRTTGRILSALHMSATLTVEHRS